MAKASSTRTTSPTDRRKTNDELAELRESVESLSQTVRVLTQAVDSLTDELQWRNNTLRDDSTPTPPPFVLHSMPKDPCSNDWKLNRVRPEQSEGPNCNGDSAPKSPPAESMQLCKELADLRLVVAALVLIVSEGYEAVSEESYELVHGWASQEYDAEILQEVIGPSAPLSAEDVKPGTEAGCASQRDLFSAGDSESADGR